MSHSTDKEKHVVIIGAGFAGVSAAKTLAEKENIKVTIVDRRNHHLFQPLLYQVATAKLSSADITRSVRNIFKNTENVSVVYDSAVDFDKQNKVVKMDSGNDLSYDYLILATGAKSSFFGQDQWAEHVLQMKSLEDALKIREAIIGNIEKVERDTNADQDKLSSIVIVGAGPTGVELAGAFADLVQRSMKSDFTNFDPSQQKSPLIEAMDFVLPPFQDNQRDYTKAKLEKLGVDVRTGSMVSNIEPNKLTLKDGEVIEAGTIIWTAGVQATDITKKLDTELTRGGLVIVDENLNLPGHKDFFVVGDTAAAANGEGKFVPGVAPAANQGGIYAAESILAAEAGQSMKPFKYKDKGKMAIIGKGSAIVDINGTQFSGPFGWLTWLFVHLMFLVDLKSMFNVFAGWVWSYLFGSAGSREIAPASDEIDKKS